MKIVFVILFILFSCAALADASKPYAGEQERKIKALSNDDIEGLISGKGMGLAKAAELNGYPGPRHTLDLKDKLSLSKDQLQQSEKLYQSMHKNTVQLGEQIVQEEKKLDDLFIKGDINSQLLKQAVTKIARLRGELRFAHLVAHLKLAKILTAEQISHYKELRGYGDGQAHSAEHKDQH
jgi:Spy/CpxP family protein refolding chaperone